MSDIEGQTRAYIEALGKVGYQYAQVIAEHGRFFQVAEEQPQTLIKKQCFFNAFTMVKDDQWESEEPVIYCEGYAVASANVVFPLEHAWVINTKGEVLDPTWSPPGVIYFGIPFRYDWLLETLRGKSYYGLLDLHSWPTDPAEFIQQLE